MATTRRSRRRTGASSASHAGTFRLLELEAHSINACVEHRHISLDVALGTLTTARALNDADFNRETAFPVVSNVAAWLLSRGEWTAKGFEVLHMGGPDESLGQVNNSNFFNVAVSFSSARSIAASHKSHAKCSLHNDM